MPTIPPAPDRSGLERRVIEIVTELVEELRGGQSSTVSLRDSLERDLGISSLERVELLIRLERIFKIRLGDTAMTTAESPADLVAAILSGGDTSATNNAHQHPAVDGNVTSPNTALTLVDVLSWHSHHNPDRTHILLTDEGPDQNLPLTYDWLWTTALQVAGGLKTRGLRRGDAVAIMLRTERDFFPTFIGTLIAGCVAVPLYPPFRADRIEDYITRHIGILKNASARLLITFSAVERFAGILTHQVSSLDNVATTASVVEEPTTPALITNSDGALIQYTSGSTGAPKGVYLTHENLLANIRSIAHALNMNSDDVGVSWLPLYHDMGLIGAWLTTFYVGAPLMLMSPLSFLARPIRWLEAISRHHGTVSAAPNFAYDLCATRIADEELGNLNLSSARALLNGSETISPSTLSAFVERFKPYGLTESAVVPVYGLAENSVALTIPTMDSSPRVDFIDRDLFQRTGSAIKTSTDDGTALRFVSCGRPVLHHEICIVDKSGKRLPDRQQGRIIFRGPSATAGYFRNEQATQQLIDQDGWLHSGDLGYIDDGNLFVTGRTKDVIIRGGRNLYPHEVEAAVGSLTGVRTGCVAAFGLATEERGTEQFVIVAETRLATRESRTELQRQITTIVTEEIGVTPDRVVLAHPGAIPKTSSGKIRRSATRDALQAGNLEKKAAGVAVQWFRIAAKAFGGLFLQCSKRIAQVLYTGYIMSLILLTGLAIFLLLTIIPNGRSADRLIGLWTRLLLACAGCRIRIVGSDRVPKNQPVVFVANHASYLDPPLLMNVLPIDVRFAAKGRLADYPILGLAIRKGGHIPISKNNQAQRIEGASDIRHPLRQGESIFIFPEGTFEEAPRLLPFRLGAFNAAVETNCPIVPVAIRGTRHIFPARTVLLKPGLVTVTFGQPLQAHNSDWKEIVRLRDEARSFISKHCGES